MDDETGEIFDALSGEKCGMIQKANEAEAESSEQVSSMTVMAEPATSLSKLIKNNSPSKKIDINLVSEEQGQMSQEHGMEVDEDMFASTNYVENDESKSENMPCFKSAT